VERRQLRSVADAFLTRMIADLSVALAFFAALGSGLMAGLFFAFSTAVMPALGSLPEEQGIAAMQKINAAILNPLFLLLFFGTAVASIIGIIASLVGWYAPRALWLLIGSFSYPLGSFLVTILFNVPLNKALTRLPAESAGTLELWTKYLPDGPPGTT
jgi:uncharacterized membrane protein